MGWPDNRPSSRRSSKIRIEVKTQLEFKSCGKERLPTLVNSSSQALDRAFPESDPQKPFTLARMIRAVGSDNQQVFRNTNISVQDCVNAFTMKSCHRSCRTAPDVAPGGNGSFFGSATKLAETPSMALRGFAKQISRDSIRPA